MARIPYEYDNESPARGGEPGAKLRLVVIFAVILAVTAAVVWMIVPHDGKKVEDPAVKDPAPAAELPAAELPAPGAVEGAVSPEVSGTAEAPAETPAGVPAEAPAEGNAGTELPAETPAAETPAPEATPLNEAPVKGVPWEGDPAEAPAASPDAAERAERERSKANMLLFDSGSGSGAVEHLVKGGESLSRISRRYHTTIEALRYTNKLKSTNIRIGQKLRVVPGPWKIEVSKSRKVLRLFRLTGSGEPELFYLFDIGIGRLNRTPSADFVVFDRIHHPKWYAPDGAVYPYGDPGNPLGDYFLKLAPAGKPKMPLTGYGIHGTSDDTAVGRSLSNGCIRMYNRDVERLWMAVPVGTAVSVKD